MKRISILLVLLALVVVACASEEAASASPSEAAATVEPTPEPTEGETPEPSEEPESSDDSGGGSGSIGDLVAALPDEVGGHPIQTVEGIEQFIVPALEAQNIDASDADFAFASWGEGTDSVALTGLRMPGLSQAELQMLAGILATASGSGPAGGVDFESETITIGGKEVLQMTGEGMPGAAYIYLVDDAFFTVVGESPELAEELLSKLP